MKNLQNSYKLSVITTLLMLAITSACSKLSSSTSVSKNSSTKTPESKSNNTVATKTLDKNNNTWKSDYKELKGFAIDIPTSELANQNVLITAALRGTSPDYSLFIAGDRQLTSSFTTTLPQAMVALLNGLSIDQIQVNFTPTDAKGNATGDSVTLTSDKYGMIGDSLVVSLSSWGIITVGEASSQVTQSAPSITSVTSTTTSGSYKVGDTISIAVTFSQAVTVTGTPKLNLNFGAPAEATYTAGSGSTTLIFSYTINPGDTIDAFDVANTSALKLDGAKIANATGASAKLTLPAPGATGSISGSAAIAIDTAAPTAPTLTGATLTMSTQPTISWTSGGGGNGTYRYKIDSSDFTSGSTTIYIASMTPSSALTNGPHTLYVQERDTAGNWSSAGSFSFTVDTTIPGAPNVTSASSVTTNNQPTWTWTTGGGNSTGNYRYKLDDSTLTSGATTTGTTSYTPASALSDGAHTLYVQEVGSLGNWSTTGSYVITIDTVPPSAPVVTSASSTATTNQPTWTWTSPGGGGGNGNYRVKLDNNTMTSGTTALTVGTYTPGSTLSEGAHTLYVQERDVAGNWSTIDSFTVTVDTVAPTAPSVNGTAVVSNARPTWSWSSTGGGNGSYRYKLDSSDLTTGATTTTSTSYTPATNLTEASHVLYVQERDAAGNWSTSGTYTTTVDTTTPLAPSLDISSKVFNANFTVTVSQNATADSNFLEYRYTTTGTAPTSCSNGTASSGSISITGTSNVTLKVIACDTAGNASGVTTGTYTYDNTAPLTPSLDISSKVFNADFTVTVSQNASTDSNFLEYRYTTTGVAPTSCNNGTASSGTISITGTSSVTLKVIACDSAGNYSSAVTGTYTYDNTAPLTPSLDISSRAYNGSITVATSQNATTDANFLEFRYTTTGTAPTSCSNGTATSGSITITDTVNVTLKVIACDAAGNASSPVTGSYTYDVTPPNAPVVTGSATATTTTPTWTWTSGGGGNGNYRYKLDSSDLTSGTTATSTASYTPGSGLTDGLHTVYVQEKDDAGNWSATGSFATTIVPYITSVTSNTTNATYGMGTVIDVRVTYSSDVTVTGTPQIAMATGGTTRYATYASAASSTVLIFNYTVGSGDASSDLNYASTSALDLNGGTIKSAANDDASLTLPATAGASSLAGSKAIVIAATPPGTFSITGPAASTNSTTPSVTWGASTGATKYDLLVDNDSDCSSPTQTYSNITGTSKALTTLSAGTYYVCMTAKDNSTNYIAATNTGYSFVIDTTAPTVSSVTSNTADGTYGVGSVIDVLVTFSEAVTVVGTPTIQLETGATDRTVNYVSGSGTNTLRFDYTVQSTDTTADLNYLATSSLTAGTSIKDSAGNNATLTLPALASASSLAGSKALIIDSTAPTVSGVNSNKANGTYYIGDVIDVRVTFSETVNVTGTPQITMETGTTDRTVNYVSGSGTTELLFNYTVQTGDTSSDLTYVATSSLALNGGTIKDVAGNNATLTLASPNSAGSLAANKALVISAAVPGSFSISSVTGGVGSATVTFGSSSNAVTYTVKRGTSSGSYPTTLTTSATSSPYVDTTAINNTTYYYMVTAVNPNGSTNASAESSVTLSSFTFVSAGADVYANAAVTLSDSMGSEGSASVQWSKTSGPGTITFGSATSATTTVSASADGTYVLRFTKTDGAGSTYYDEMNLYWDTTAPTFTSVNLAGPVADGTLTLLERRSGQALVSGVVSSGGTSTSYFLTQSSTDCSTIPAAAFKLTAPTGKAPEITADTNYKVCVRIADDAGNAAVGESSNFAYDSTSVTRKTVTKIATNQHTCAILSDGSLRCWGYNQSGELGYNDTTHRGTTAGSMAQLAAVNIGTGRTAKSVVTGSAHTCVILDTDAVKCWGSGSQGRLGYGSTTSYGDGANSISAVGTVNLGTGRTAKALSAGLGHTCSILDDNSVKCWGDSWYGQVASSYTTYTSPTAVNIGASRTAKAIASGDSHNCAVLDTDAVYCWGYDGYGQLGGYNVSLGSGRTAKAVSAGNQHSCALLDDNTVKCWGGNGSGQLGYDDTTSRSSPGPAVNLGSGRTATALSAGLGNTCVILDTNAVKCWGAGSYGAVGNSDYKGRGQSATYSMETLDTVNLGTGRTAVSITAGQYAACAVLDTGDAKCWGYNAYGALGQDDTLPRGGSGGSMASLATVNLGTGRTAKSVVQGENHACVILDNNSLKCWGANSAGQLGQDNTTAVGGTAGAIANLSAINLGTGRTAKSVALGYAYTCAILDDNTLKCWGSNGYGQLGRDNTTTMGTTAGHMASLTAINLGTGRTAKSVSAGYATTCAILDNDTMKCWGWNWVGQIANGNTTDKGGTSGDMAALPTVNSGMRFRTVATSGYATCAVNFTYMVYCWGYYGAYNFSAVGSGTYSSPAFTSSLSPRGLRSLTSVQGLSNGPYGTFCYLKDDYSGICGGQAFNPSGSTFTSSKAITMLSVGEGACAITSDGALHCWGTGFNGAMGDDFAYYTGSNVAANFSASRNVNLGAHTAKSVSVGANGNTCVILDDDTLKCWGYNKDGQLGYGDTYNRSGIPVSEVDAIYFP